MRYNSVHSIPGNLSEIKALIHFPNWGRGEEKEKKKDGILISEGALSLTTWSGGSELQSLACHFIHPFHKAI